MKKVYSILITVLLAIVLSLSLFACNPAQNIPDSGGNGGGSDIEKPDEPSGGGDEGGGGGEITPPEKTIFTYTQSSEELTITGFTSSVYPKKVIVPETIDGKTVIAIADQAFSGKTGIVSVTLPSTLKTIGKSSFEGCYALVSVVLNSALPPVFGQNAFSNTNSALKIYVPKLSEDVYLDFEGWNAYSNHIHQSDAIFGDFSVKRLDSSVEIIQYLGEVSEEKTIVVPAEIDGKAVTTIQENAFTGRGVGRAHVVISEGVQFIADYAFYGFEPLVSLTLPKSIKSVGKNAFYGCSFLQTITTEAEIPFEVEATSFKATNTKLKIFVPENCLDSYRNAWREYFSRIFISGSIYEDYSIKKINGGVAITGYLGTDRVITIPEEIDSMKVIEIDDYAFFRSQMLESVTLNGTVKVIGANAFEGCSNLRQVNFTDNSGIEEIRSYAFSNCSKLETVELPFNILSIGEYAFANAKNIIIETSAYVPEIAVNAFGSNINQVKIFVPASKLAEYKNNWNNLAANIYPKSNVYNGFLYQVNGEEVTVTGYIGSESSISIPISIDGKTVTAIGDGVFYGKTDLQKIIMTNSVAVIGNNAFNGCSALKEVIFGNVEQIGSNAFIGCDALTSVVLKSTQPPILSSSVTFSFNLFIFVPAESLQRYQTANHWRNFSSQIYSSESNLQNYIVSPSGNGMKIVKYIGNEENIVIPETIGNKTVIEIAAGAFNGAGNAISITVPFGVEKIGNAAFATGSSLKEIIVSAQNKTYRSVNGVLYDNKVNTLITCPSGYAGQYTIPSSVVTIGAEAFKNCKNLTEIKFTRDSVETVEKNAFYGCVNLISCELPVGVKSVGSGAFAGCVNLSGNLFAQNSKLSVLSESAYENCASITSVRIPSAVTVLKPFVFSGCSSLNNVVFENGSALGVISEFAFQKCTNLSNITLPANLTRIEDSAFMGCQRLESVFALSAAPAEIGMYVFGNNNSLRIYVDPASVELFVSNWQDYIDHICAVTSIKGEYAVSLVDGKYVIEQYVGKSKDIEVPAQIDTIPVSQIGKYAFRNNSVIESVTIPASVKLIGDEAFAGCGNLKMLSVKGTNIEIGYQAFYGCSQLSALMLDTSIAPAITENTFDWTFMNVYVKNVRSFSEEPVWKSHVDTIYSQSIIENGIAKISTKEGEKLIQYFGKDLQLNIDKSITSIADRAFAFNDYLTFVTFGEGMISVGDYAFYGCENLTSVNLNKGIGEIGDYAFAKCTSLQKIGSDDNCQLRFIGIGAFENCRSLTEVTIQQYVTAIGENAFNGCLNLKSMTVKAIIPPCLDGNIFGTIKCEIKVSEYSLDQYREQWSDYANYISQK